MKTFLLKTSRGNLELNRLPEDFYLRSAVTVAKELLGKVFVKFEGNKILAAKIIETEAYGGSGDEASHSFKGKTPRNSVMFEKGGILYVYFIYGNYYCLNVVTGFEGEGTAVLIRAMEPLSGVDYLALNRFGKEDITEKENTNLLSGPGKICQAFNITKNENGLSLFKNSIGIFDGLKESFEIVATGRIGIKKGLEKQWRFYIKNSPFISRK